MNQGWNINNSGSLLFDWMITLTPDSLSQTGYLADNAFSHLIYLGQLQKQDWQYSC
jgi:hypothetical protein